MVSFIADPICEGDTFEFINTSQMSPNQIFTDFQWIGDTVWVFNGNILSQQLPIWNFPAPNQLYPPNIYGLNLTIETSFISEYDNKHCSATHPEVVEILVMPKISYSETFNPLTKCGNNVIYNFNSTHQDVNSWIYEINDPWQTDFIDSTNIDFNYTFLKPFNYPFTIILNNLNGCSDTITDFLHIFPNPVALFNPSDTAGCEKLIVPFRNFSYILDTNSLYLGSLTPGDSTYIQSYYWDLGNGNSSGDFNYTETYFAQNGTTSVYYPTLRVSTNEGCAHTFYGDSISVYPTPIAFVIHPDQYGPVNPGQYIFNGTLSTTSDGSPASPTLFDYIWATAGDSIWNKLPTPDSIAYQYQSNSNFQGGPEPILYDVCLILIDNSQYRCADTFCITPGLYVDYFRGLYVPNALTPNSSTNETSFFLPKGKSLKEYQLQIFDKWGGLLWGTTKLDNTGKPAIGWDGTSRGVPVPQGTYVWKIHAIFSDGTVWQGKDGFKTGAIYLVR
jgi:gliding motility-associated-like protein